MSKRKTAVDLNDTEIEQIAAAQGNLSARPDNAEHADIQPADDNYISLLDIDILRAAAEEEVAEKRMSGELYNLDFLCNGKAREWLENGRTYLKRSLQSKAAWTDERSDKVEQQQRDLAQRAFKLNAAEKQMRVLMEQYEERFGQRWVKPVRTDKLDTSQNATVRAGEELLDYLANL